LTKHFVGIWIFADSMLLPRDWRSSRAGEPLYGRRHQSRDCESEGCAGTMGENYVCGEEEGA
jgi:hypothetical protein